MNQELAKVDESLVELIERRAQLLAEISRAGGELDARQDAVELTELIDSYKGPLPVEQIRAVLREVQSVSRSAVQAVRVAYLGPAHSYSHQAALEEFGSGASLSAVASIATVFSEVSAGRVDLGVAPIENSTDGRIVDTLSLLARNPLRISGEIKLKIHHCLLGKGTLEAVTEVYSKPQALSQCRDWLAANLPDAETREVASTAHAAELAAEQPGRAAVASRQAGRHYSLDTLAANIEDNPNNLTRFAVLGGDKLPLTGNDKTTLMFQLPHRSGTLADAMAIFKQKQLNLTWIESFPMAGAPSEYVFFVELEGHEDEEDCRDAVGLLREKTERLAILGSYPRSQPIG